MKPPKTLIRIGVVLLIVVASGLLVRALLNFTEGRALAKALAELKARGIPLTASDLASPCPDEDNAARLLKAFENIVTFPGRQARASGAVSPGDRARDRENRRAGIEAGLLVGRTWTDFTQGKPLAAADRAALEELIRKNEKAFAILAEMGDKPCFLYRDPETPLVESQLPDGNQMIKTIKLLMFASLFSAENGDVHGAVDKLVAGLKFAPLSANEGFLISYLIPAAYARILSQPLGEICRGREVAEADIARLMAVLDPGLWPDRLVAGFRGERVFFIEIGGYILEGSLADLGSIWEGPHWWQQLGLWILRPLVKRDMRRSLSNFEFLEAQAKLPYYRIRDALRAYDRDIKERPWYAFLSKMAIGESETVFMKTAQTEAIMLASRAGLTCRLFKSRTGHYPASLDELVPDLLKEVPIDPFTGKPLVYRREGEGFIVYSLGSNQKDDGGRSTYMITQLVMDKDDDWSWKEDR